MTDTQDRPAQLSRLDPRGRERCRPHRSGLRTPTWPGGFAPRIRDLADKRLYVPDAPRHYPALEAFIGARINAKQILTQ
jgi:hypothetical protein